MTAVSEDASAELKRRIAELEQRLDTALVERDAAIDRQTASALVNFRLQNEVRAALDRQKAGTEILRAIAATAGDAEHALQTIAETTQHFFNAASVTIRVAVGDEWVQTVRVGASSELRSAHPAAPLATRGANLPATVYQENRQIHIPDLDHVDPSMADWPAVAARAAGIRTMSGTPLRREGKAIGALIVFRDRLAPFTPDELALQQSFADQAVIAIENARLFNATQEALARQSATSEILEVINSSPTDLAPVFDRILQKAHALCGIAHGSLQLCEGEHLYAVAVHGVSEQFENYLRQRRPIAELPAVQTLLGGERYYQINDARESAYAGPRKAAEIEGTRTILGVPLRREDRLLGIIFTTRREVKPFTEREISLLESFADQAVIAIESARLFNETQEALARQTATADILRVISGSPTDVQPVFDAIVLTAQRLLGRDMAFILLCDGDTTFRPVAITGPAGLVQIRNPDPIPIDPEANFPSRAIVSKTNQHLPDWSAIDLPDEERKIQEMYGLNSALYLPMLRGDECIGVLGLGGRQPGIFSEADIALAESFRDQAVIAIENTRLFNETQDALARQTATADILRVISASPTDVQPVFDAIVQTAVQLIGCETSFIQRCDGTHFWTAARCRREGGLVAVFNTRPAPIDPSANFPSRAIVAKETLYLPDWSEIELPEFERRIRQELGYNCAVYLPLLREGECIGVLGIAGSRPHMFSKADIALAESFRDQAVIAIENARLFNETQEALEQQTATADILRVIASSPSDVTPVFEAIVTSAKRLLGGFSASVLSVKDGAMHLEAFTPLNPEADEFLQRAFPLPLAEYTPLELVQKGESIQFADALTAPEFQAKVARARGFRSIIHTPLMQNGATIGLITVTRLETGSFADHHVQLLQTFADQAVIAIENTRLFNETQESLERQTATADILKVIASSPSETRPVFEAIAYNSKHLIGGFSTAVFRFIDGTAHLASYTPISPDADAVLNASFPRPLGELYLFDLAKGGEIVEEADTETNPDAGLRDLARARGFRSTLLAPLMSKETPIGLIVVTRKEPGRFARHHVQLLQTFADQAVIAIENTRLFNETKEALERQTATAEILRVIASSPSDVQPVFEAIVNSAADLFAPHSITITTLKDDKLHWRATAARGPSFDLEKAKAVFPVDFDPARAPSARAILERRIIEISDAASPDTPELARRVAIEGGFRNVTIVPLVHQDRGIGTIILTHPQAGFRLTASQLALVQTFADQAVIAIENTRLFNETREALERQTATADILRVIASSPSDVAPVFEAIAASANRLLGGFSTAVFRFIDGMACLEAFTPTTPEADEILRSSFPSPLTEFGPFELSQGGKPVQVPDTEKLVHARIREISRARGFRSMLFLPLMNAGAPIGVISVTRIESGTFAEHHVQLLQTFADQAVIAIENTRLFNEVRAKTHDLEESLQQQTATAEVLQIISSSPDDLTPVFDKMLENATKVCGARFGSMVLVEGEMYRRAALYNAPAEFAAIRSNELGRIHPQSAIIAAIRSRQVVQTEDIRNSPAYLARAQHAVELAELGGARTLAVVPMVRDDEAIGVITVYRQEVRLFDAKQIDLLTNFARQAVIAIENARLLRELRQRTDDLSESLQQQTATADVLKVISSSPGDLGPVFRSMLENAVSICDAQFGNLLLVDGDRARWEAGVGTPPKLAEFFTQSPWFQPTPGGHVHRVMRTKQVSHTVDDLAEPVVGAAARLGGARSTVCVPMVKDDVLVGTIFIYRTEVRPFTDKQIDLVKNFAAQAVIAIENTRLLKELRQRTDDLTKSLDDLRAAQDRLVQTEKLASLGQLTAGIAHEIKNPLNFVNNFAALSAELTDELKESLKPAVLDETIRAEVNEITGMLKDNLGKVVQHGKRADSIVKNMLLHSREGSGEHRPSDINALVDESLNLAYHGARAEKPQFNVTLRRDFDPGAGMVEVFPQEITRVLLNLISNGFYAVTKRKADNGNAPYEPEVAATTRGGDDHVEIRIRDNGTGIPPEVREKMFNPFFTTKPAGEGTGLGLSMSHDIIVKQHGGTIEVETEPGAFTEFRILLRRSSLPGKAGGN